MASALTSVRTGRALRFSRTRRLTKRYNSLQRMKTPILMAVLACACGAQPSAEFLSRLDGFAKTFTGVKASLRNTNHVGGIPDEVQTGTFILKRESGNKVRMRIDFTGNNTYTVSVHDDLAEEYRPKLNEIQEYDIRKFKDVAQTMFLLGFGMSGKQLTAAFEMKSLEREKLNGEDTTRVQ